MILAIFKALFAIGASVVLALSAILFIIFLWDECHDNMGE